MSEIVGYATVRRHYSGSGWGVFDRKTGIQLLPERLQAFYPNKRAAIAQAKTLPARNPLDRHSCDECPETFETAAGLASHQRNRHPHGCPICEGGDGSACVSHFI